MQSDQYLSIRVIVEELNTKRETARLTFTEIFGDAESSREDGDQEPHTQTALSVTEFLAKKSIVVLEHLTLIISNSM
jgi:hypothetical protein